MNRVDLLGWCAAGLMLLSFSCSDVRRLRMLAIAANVAFISYGLLAGLHPIAALHLMLLPMNAWRLAGILKGTGHVPREARAQVQLSAHRRMHEDPHNDSGSDSDPVVRRRSERPCSTDHTLRSAPPPGEEHGGAGGRPRRGANLNERFQLKPEGTLAH